MTRQTVMLNAYFLRFFQGSSLGLYLYIYSLTLYKVFHESSDPSFADAVSAYIAAVFVFGLILEALLEIPLGAFGDIIGYKPTLTLSFLFRTFYFIGFILLINNPSVSISLAFVSIGIFSISYTLWSGTNSAWFYDSIKSFGLQDEYEKLLSRTLIVYYISLISSSILSAYLFFNNNDNGLSVYIIGSILCAIGTVYCWFFLYSPKHRSTIIYRKKPIKDYLNQYVSELGSVASDAIRYTFKNKSIFQLLQVNALFTLLVYVIDFLWPIYAENKLKIEPAVDKSDIYPWITIIVILTLGVFIGNAVVVRLSSYKGLRTMYNQWKLLLISCLVMAIPILILSVYAFIYDTSISEHQWVIVVFLTVSSIGQGIKEAPFEVLMNRSISNIHSIEGSKKPGEVRATILSAGTIFTSFAVLFFFLPTIVITTNNTKFSSLGWAIPALLLIAVSLVNRKYFKEK